MARNDAATDRLLPAALAKEFFDLGKSFAYAKASFNNLRFQARVYGGELTRECDKIKAAFEAVNSKMDNSERLDPAALRRDLSEVERKKNRVENKLISAFLVSRSTGYDVVG